MKQHCIIHRYKSINFIFLKTFKWLRSLLSIQEGKHMKLGIMEKNLDRRLVIYGILFLFVCVSITPAMGTFSQNHRIVSSNNNVSMKTNEGDIPTWYTGDQWTYMVSPLSFSSPNGSFDGSIENFRQTVVGIVDDTYKIDISGDINGDIAVNGFSGELTGDIVGTSYVRVSDLGQETSEIHSQGTITYMWIPFDYEMNLYTSSSPALEVYDFPFNVGEQWQLSGVTTVAGSFTIQGVFDQSFDENQFIDETVECIQLEQISVPAGSYECYKIGRESSLSWFSTDVGNMVKTTIDQSGENMTMQLVMTLQSFTHVNQPITVSEEISPAVGAPGVSVVVSGQAISTGSGEPVQNGAISINIPSTGESYSTTTNSAGYYSRTIEALTILDDTPSGREAGSDGIIVKCTSNGLFGYRVQTFTTIQDTAPATPSIQGPTEGKPKVEYSYYIMTVDPEGDEIFYYVDWGDSTNLSWFGPFASDENVSLSHTFTKKGSYTIRVQARDSYYAVSDWGTLQVTMPTESSSPFIWMLLHRFPLIFSLLQQFLGE
jgi:hypothetical protein